MPGVGVPPVSAAAKLRPSHGTEPCRRAARRPWPPDRPGSATRESVRPRSSPGHRSSAGDPVRVQVGRLVVAVDAELTEGLAVVARHDDRGLVVDAERDQLVQDSTDVLVGVADRDVVAVEHAGEHRSPCRSAAAASGEPVEPPVGREPQHFLRRVRARELPVPGQHVVVDPGRRGVVDEGFPHSSGVRYGVCGSQRCTCRNQSSCRSRRRSQSMATGATSSARSVTRGCRRCRPR